MLTGTRFQEFLDKATADESFRVDTESDGTYEFMRTVKVLTKFSRNLSQPLLVYMFGEQLGEHLFEKFAVQCRRDVLCFLPTLSDEYKFFILYEIKNNEELYCFA